MTPFMASFTAPSTLLETAVGQEQVAARDVKIAATLVAK